MSFQNQGTRCAPPSSPRSRSSFAPLHTCRHESDKSEPLNSTTSAGAACSALERRNPAPRLLWGHRHQDPATLKDRRHPVFHLAALPRLRKGEAASSRLTSASKARVGAYRVAGPCPRSSRNPRRAPRPSRAGEPSKRTETMQDGLRGAELSCGSRLERSTLPHGTRASQTGGGANAGRSRSDRRSTLHV